MEKLADGDAGSIESTFVEAFRAATASHAALDPMAFVDAMLAAPWDTTVTAAGAALQYARSRPSPKEGEPWPAELVAAQLLMDVYLFASRVRSQRRTLVGRNIVDAVDISELIWIGMRIGALSEALRPGFRPDLGATMDAARKALEARQVGQAKGAKRTKEKAEAWRKLALEIARRRRDQNPKKGDSPLAREVWEELRGGDSPLEKVPAEATVARLIRSWVADGSLSASLARPAPKGGKA
ncbi:hypothetical protein [Phenylobacterium sp.]|uniref:hypothetical protein n=1 Tax=Phenylobacterium sp. TaxID=1871053 RepID=UPI0035AF4B52